MSLAAVVAVSLAIALASVVTTVAGFGFSLMAVPLLAAVLGPRDAVAVASLLGVLSVAVIFWGSRAAADWVTVRRQLGAAVIGMPLGLAAVAVLDDAALRLGIAVVVLLATAVLARGYQLTSSGRAVDLVAGLLSGALNTSVGTNGPPLVLADQAHGLAPEAFRGTLTAVLGGSALVTNPLFALTGRYTPEVLTAAAAGLPALTLGWVVGRRLQPRVAPERFRTLVLVLLVLSALVAAATALVG